MHEAALASGHLNKSIFMIDKCVLPRTHGNSSNNCVLATGGMYADATTLVKVLEQRLTWYTFAHEGTMSAPAMAQMLAITLYGRRFFPYYVWNTLGGLDTDGSGAVFSYDPVGNFEKRKWNCAGSAGHLIQPFLDSQVCVYVVALLCIALCFVNFRPPLRHTCSIHTHSDWSPPQARGHQAAPHAGAGYPHCQGRLYLGHRARHLHG
jgi:hypothetical protein